MGPLEDSCMLDYLRRLLKTLRWSVCRSSVCCLTWVDFLFCLVDSFRESHVEAARYFTAQAPCSFEEEMEDVELSDGDSGVREDGRAIGF